MEYKLNDLKSAIYNENEWPKHGGMKKAELRVAGLIVGCRAKVFFKFHFKLMQKFRFQYQFEDIELPDEESM